MTLNVFCLLTLPNKSDLSFSFRITVAAFQVVWMGGVVNSTRSNRFTNGLNTTHDAAFFYSSTAGVYQEPWVSTTAVTRYVLLR